MSFIKEDFCPEKDEKIISPMSCYDKYNPFKILRQKNHSDQLADQKYNNVFSRNAVKTIFYPVQWDARALFIQRRWRTKRFGKIDIVKMKGAGRGEEQLSMGEIGEHWHWVENCWNWCQGFGRWSWREAEGEEGEDSHGWKVGHDGEWGGVEGGGGHGRSQKSRWLGAGVRLQPQPRAPWCAQGGGRRAWHGNQIQFYKIPFGPFALGRDVLGVKANHVSVNNFTLVLILLYFLFVSLYEV